MTATVLLALSSTQRWWLVAILVIVVIAAVVALIRDHNRSSWRVEVERRRAQMPAVDGQAVTEVDALLGSTSVGGWWTGRNEDLAHAALDQCERRAALAADPSDRGDLARALTVKAKRALTAKDPARKVVLGLLAATPEKGELATAYDLVNEAWSRLRRTQRARRNRAILLSIAFVIAGLAVAWTLDRGVGNADLRPHDPPAGSTTTTTAATGSDGSGGSDGSDGSDVDAAAGAAAAASSAAGPDDGSAEQADGPDEPDPTTSAFALLGLGAVGGLISLFRMNRRTPDITRSSGAWTAQAALKVTSGSLLALLGCWFLQSGLAEPFQRLDANQLAFWAVLFGYSQDVVTKRFDARLTPAPTQQDPTGDED